MMFLPCVLLLYFALPVLSFPFLTMKLPQQQPPLKGGISRSEFGLATVGVGLGLLTASGPAVADSTGKLSTKLTAKRRYVPRINAAVTEFQSIEGVIAKDPKEWKPAKDFVAVTVPDVASALNLLGSSFKNGEYPDATSKARQAEAAAFIAKMGDLNKALSAKNAPQALKAYGEGKGLLNKYLDGCELPLLTSEPYKGRTF
ncbi:unnamed protein product [Chrysoparadoxa australica]